jgi:hypothetical protein
MGKNYRKQYKLKENTSLINSLYYIDSNREIEITRMKMWDVHRRLNSFSFERSTTAQKQSFYDFSELTSQYIIYLYLFTIRIKNVGNV